MLEKQKPCQQCKFTQPDPGLGELAHRMGLLCPVLKARETAHKQPAIN